MGGCAGRTLDGITFTFKLAARQDDRLWVQGFYLFAKLTQALSDGFVLGFKHNTNTACEDLSVLYMEIAGLRSYLTMANEIGGQPRCLDNSHNGGLDIVTQRP